MTNKMKMTDDLLSRIEHAISFFNQCRPRERFSVEELNTIRALRDAAKDVCDSGKELEWGTGYSIQPEWGIGYSLCYTIDKEKLDALRQLLPKEPQ